jgi:hypothetical protein
MAENAPRNFRIAAPAREKISQIIDDEMKNFDPSKVWVAAIVWSRSHDPNGSIIGDGPAVAIYDRNDVPVESIIDIGGCAVVFPGVDQSHFHDKVLNFDKGRGFFLEGVES